ncbi:hypothetical protein JKY72_06225 [Candidatus Gracilibacteria bacterium]|nr:hypothetical protein [Candidatus Gracilibacteria bacterium]
MAPPDKMSSGPKKMSVLDVLKAAMNRVIQNREDFSEAVVNGLLVDKESIDGGLEKAIMHMHKEYELGEYTPDTEIDIEDITQYLSVGSVNRVSHSLTKKREESWYTEKARDAGLMLNAWDKLDIQFPSIAGKTVKYKEILAEMSEMDDFGDTELAALVKKHGRETILGAEGILNLILSYQRAAKPFGDLDISKTKNIGIALKLSTEEEDQAKDRFVAVVSLKEEAKAPTPPAPTPKLAP